MPKRRGRRRPKPTHHLPPDFVRRVPGTPKLVDQLDRQAPLRHVSKAYEWSPIALAFALRRAQARTPWTAVLAARVSALLTRLRRSA